MKSHLSRRMEIDSLERINLPGEKTTSCERLLTTTTYHTSGDAPSSRPRGVLCERPTIEPLTRKWSKGTLIGHLQSRPNGALRTVTSESGFAFGGPSYKKTYTVRGVVYVRNPKAPNFIALFRSNADCVALLRVRDSGRVVDFQDCAARVRVDICKLLGHALGGRNEVHIPIHLVIVCNRILKTIDGKDRVKGTYNARRNPNHRGKLPLSAL